MPIGRGENDIGAHQGNIGILRDRLTVYLALRGIVAVTQIDKIGNCINLERTLLGAVSGQSCGGSTVGGVPRRDAESPHIGDAVATYRHLEFLGKFSPIRLDCHDKMVVGNSSSRHGRENKIESAEITGAQGKSSGAKSEGNGFTGIFIAWGAFEERKISFES